MKKNNIIALLSSSMLLITACYSDKGNYDYHDINEITIEGLPDSEVTVFQHADVLEIKPTLKNTLETNPDNYKYTWVAYSTTGSTYNAPDTLSTERNLNYRVTINQGTYWVYCYVLDTKTGVEWNSKFDLLVTSSTRDGWMILQDENSRPRLDMISIAGGKEYLLKDILANNNLPYKKPIAINCASDMNLIDYYTPSIELMTEDGVTNLDPNTLLWSEDMDFKYIFGEKMDAVKAKDIHSVFFSGGHTCVTEDNIYHRNTAIQGSIYSTAINFINGEAGYFKPAPFIGVNIDVYAWDPPVIFYDTENKRFIQASQNNKSCRIPTAVEDQFTNTTGKDMVTMINTRHNGSRTYSLLRDNSNKIWLYGFNMSPTLKQAPGYYYQIDAPGIETATKFAIHPYLFYMFYVSNNKIYQFDLTTKEHKEIAHSFTGEEITLIKFNVLYSGSTGKPKEYADREYRLIVGSAKNGVDADKCGVVRMFNIDTNFQKDIELFKQYDGYAKPVDVTYRERGN